MTSDRAAESLISSIGATILACSVFLLDRFTEMDAAVSVLYLLALIVGAMGRGRAAVYFWTGVCLVLSIASPLLANGNESIALVLSDALLCAVAVCATSFLLLSRLSLRDTQRALQESEANQRNFADTVPQFLWRAREDGSIDYFNRRYTEITGHDRDEAVRDQSWVERIHPDDLERFQQVWDEARRTSSEVRNLFRVRYRDGEYRWMVSQGRLMADPQDSSIKRWYGGLAEIDAEVRAQEETTRLADALEDRVRERSAELVRSEGRFRTLFQDMNIAYAEQDISAAKALLDGVKAGGVTDFKSFAVANPEFIDNCLAAISVVSVNDALLSMMGYHDQEELVSKPPTANAEDARRIMSLQLQAIFEDRRHFTATTVLIGKDDRRVPVAVGVNMLADWSTSLSTHVDISEQQHAHEMMLEAREDLARANRSATIGALSASLAHELNQPLLAILMDAQTSRRWLKRAEPEVDEALKLIDRVSENANRMSGIVKRTRDQLIKARRTPDIFSVGDLAHETGRLLERDLSQRRATLKVSVAKNGSSVLADRTEIQQVLINLAINAADAMNSLPRERAVEILVTRQSPDEVMISVEDVGPGVEQDHLKMLFEPFFSTKPGGMGMGLQICRTIIEAWGGRIWVENRGSGGAAFRFTLPAADIIEMPSCAGRSSPKLRV